MIRRPTLSVDLFAGGGGASEAIRQATGRAPIVAVNHCAHAIQMHTLNHPETIHLHSSVHDVAPLQVAAGIPIDLLWLSPDCTHFSRAKGGTPRSQGIRDLAWVAVDWARAVAPGVIILENACSLCVLLAGHAGAHADVPAGGNDPGPDGYW